MKTGFNEEQQGARIGRNRFIPSADAVGTREYRHVALG